MKKIYFHSDRCLGCRACELACIIEHSSSKDLRGAVCEDPPPPARIRVEGADPKKKQSGSRCTVFYCRHCRKPSCLMACTSDAISIDEHTGIVRLDEEACVGCWLCIEACPFGAIVRRSDGETAVKCDRCGDREIPACVEACPTGALIFCEKGEYEALISEGGAVQRN